MDGMVRRERRKGEDVDGDRYRREEKQGRHVTNSDGSVMQLKQILF